MYDGRCHFCTRAAEWAVARARVPMAAVPFEDVPRAAWLTSLSEDDLLRQAHFVTPSGIEYHGGQATTAALRHTRHAWAGRLLDAPLLSLGRDAGYAVVVRGRGVLSRVLDWGPGR